jgi:hypothetical protein
VTYRVSSSRLRFTRLNILGGDPFLVGFHRRHRGLVSHRRECSRDGVQVHEQAERRTWEWNEAVCLVVGSGLLVLRIDDQHDRAHRF